MKTNTVLPVLTHALAWGVPSSMRLQDDPNQTNNLSRWPTPSTYEVPELQRYVIQMNCRCSEKDGPWGGDVRQRLATTFRTITSKAAPNLVQGLA